MDCKAAAPLLEAYFDGELDKDEARALEAHVDECADCRDALTAMGQVRHALRTQATRHVAPQSLRERIASEVTQARPSASRRGRRRWYLAAACLAAFVAGSAVTQLWTRSSSSAGEQVARDLFASHWRALAATSPVDVVSSDRHTVKPWFAGKLAVAPVVKDFADQGFPLVGGRLDYAGSQRVAVLVYRHDRHLIDVFVSPGAAEFPTANEARQGYSLVVAKLGDQSVAIVSDLDAQELSKFRQLLDEPAPRPAP